MKPQKEKPLPEQEREKELQRKRFADKYLWPAVPVAAAAMAGIITTMLLLSMK